MAPITQIVLFEPKADTTVEQQKKTFDEGLALKSECLRPDSKTPYIRSLVGGKGNIIDPTIGPQENSTIVFIIEFANEEDQQFFNTKDAAHAGFIQRNIAFAAKTQVLPFTPGVC